jgi:hypothetical protein
MPPQFFEKAGSKLSPGDILQTLLPFSRLPKPLTAIRKPKINLPPKLQPSIHGELREVFEVGRHHPDPDFKFDSVGEEVVSHARISMAIFLTWGSEVDSDVSAGKLNKKDWLIAPLFPLAAFEGRTVSDKETRSQINLATAIREGRSPKYFPLQALPGEFSTDYYADFRKIFPLAASHFEGTIRNWRLAPVALNDFYSQLLWFFTRKKVFFGPVPCSSCGAPVDLGVTFEGQPLGGEQD